MLSKAAIVFDSFGSPKSVPFVSANFGAAIVCTPSPRGSLGVAKYSIVPGPKGVNIGAVNWPYDTEETFAAINAETRAYKTAAVTFNAVKLGNTYSRVRFDRDKNCWLSGTTQVESRDIAHLYFNSKLLKECEARVAAGQEPFSNPIYPNDYFQWMLENRDNKKILDVGLDTGVDMASVVDKLYFDPHVTPTSELILPSFYLRTRAELAFDSKAIDTFILRAARKGHSPLGPRYLNAEMAPYPCVVRDAVDTGEFIVVKIEKVRFYAGHIVTTGQFEELSFPTGNNISEKYTTELQKAAVDGEPSKEDVLNEFDPLVKVLPVNPAYSDLAAVEDMIGEKAMSWVRAQVIAQHRPTIEGVPSVDLSILSEFPEGVGASNIFMRNRRIAYLYKGDPSGLCDMNAGKHISVDLLHHRWYQEQPVREQRPHVSRNTGPLTSKLMATPAGDSSLGKVLEEAVKEAEAVPTEMGAESKA